MLRPRFTEARPAELAELKKALREISRRRGFGDLHLAISRSPGRGFRPGRDVVFPPISLPEAGVVLEAMTRLAERAVEAGQVAKLTRRVLESRAIRYIRFDPLEHWMFARQTVANRGGDCEDLSTYLAGTLRAAGRRARAILIPGPGLIAHVLVELPGGRQLDPSIWGGMNSPREVNEAMRGELSPIDQAYVEAITEVLGW